ncbi:hypothetical protein Bca52824_042555 [Brassica carinata]|uniref:BZIP domain-containing protein n=1 Tax=Brassica carinata TaxID=52824 RepID=A0A8X7RXG5_BRACI|nr:hypothetical protein Bca52824_042555 [Brassica carinata]
MGNSEEPKPTKSDKPSSSPADQTNAHVYPDWAAMLAYYGPNVAMPPYYNSAMAASGHPPPYMWNHQHMMSPYGTPYHGGGVYAHPGIPMANNFKQSDQGDLLFHNQAGTPLNIDIPTKSTGNTDNGLMKKLKEFDGLAMSLGIGNPPENNGDDERKRSRNSSETEDGKRHLVQCSSFRSVSPTSGDNGVKPVQRAIVSPDDERELKRERRKQSNRESARRSRLRKQAETEELARKVEALTAENMALRSELNQLNEKSDKLRGANATLLDKLKSSEPEKIVSIVKNSGTGDNESNSTSKLHQLLDTKPRADAVAAG